MDRRDVLKLIVQSLVLHWANSGVQVKWIPDSSHLGKRHDLVPERVIYVLVYVQPLYVEADLPRIARCSEKEVSASSREHSTLSTSRTIDLLGNLLDINVRQDNCRVVSSQLESDILDVWGSFA